MSCCNQGRCGECKCRQAVSDQEVDQDLENAKAIALVLFIVISVVAIGHIAAEFLWPILRGVS